MKRLAVFFAFALLFCAGFAKAQSCPGGFWGNGQCIGACDSPLINPNVSLKFYGWSCFGSSRIICTDGGVFCYPEYTAYDLVYGQYCGVITDYGSGECTFPYLGLNQQAPHSPFRLALDMRRPAEFKPRPIKQVQIKDRFWWKHTQKHA